MKYLALFLIFLFQAVHAEEPAPWRIAIIGDTHDSPKRMEGSEGVAVNFIKTLYGEILKHQVDMVVQVGDMADIEGSAPVNGRGTIQGTLPAYPETGRQRAGHQKTELRHPP